MKKTLGTFMTVMMITACGGADETPVASATIDQAAMQQEAAGIAGQFAGTLLPTLQQAMQEGGAVNGINVCSVQAPLIAQNLSEQSGWQVKRVSLKARNSALATPDAWETAVLQEFDQRQQSGEPAGQINKAELVDGEFRYMQAQPTGPLCLSCHGTEIAPEVSAALAQHYPMDLATGYLEGQVRGAISLRAQP
ncbi:MAG: DUF3365 domain-containing protein [Pseudohongiella sp.]|nr:DUF3365 domain-containing protein [Pseudohongiella sp.]MDP2128848.1 DUF3365 domain-containing protein [Pseudohongiella sp.]